MNYSSLKGLCGLAKSILPLRQSYRCLCSQQQHYRVVKPGKVSPTRPVPNNIQKPPYVSNYLFKYGGSATADIEIKTDKQIAGMRDACKLAREILMRSSALIKPGITTEQIDEFVHNLAVTNGAYPSPLLYKGFPKSVCTSVNNVGCHGIPDDQPLVEGDLINVDITVYLNGFHGDTSETFIVGETDAEGEVLIETATACRDAGIAICGPGVPFKNIGAAISEEAGILEYAIVKDICAHGIGEVFHAPPICILQCENNHHTEIMKEGMTFTVEPLISEGSSETRILSDGWTIITVDDSRTAQCEHTILITKNGPEILTLI